MENVLKIIKEIEQTSSRNEKENILKQNKENILLKEILQFIFDPYTVTGISSKKYKKNVKEFVKGNITTVNELMGYLRKNNTGTDKDVSEIQFFISNQPESLKELYAQIVTKSLKIGVTSKTLNKIYGKDFIKEFNVMLAEKYFDNIDKVTEEFIVTTKLDGGRAVIIKENGSTKVFTRQGQLIEDLIEIEDESQFLPDNTVYDGELLLRNDKGLESKDLYRVTMKETRKDGEKRNLIFNCFDIIPLQDFKNGICKIPCCQRKNQLHDLLDRLNLKYIIEVPILHRGNDKSNIIELLNEARAKNEEGIMLNISNAPYECKRTRNLLKVKVMQSVDLKIIGFEQGEGRLKNILGKIIVDYKGYHVGVGSGFSDFDREYIWTHQDELLSKIVEVQYFEETQNQNGGISIRFPVFKGLRLDKDEPSYN